MNGPQYSLSFDEFKRLASRGNLIPVYREILADLETPVSAFSKIPSRRKDHPGLPELAFLLTDTLLIFDNVAQKIKVVANAHVTSRRDAAIKAAYADAIARIEQMIARLRRPLRPRVRSVASG